MSGSAERPHYPLATSIIILIDGAVATPPDITFLNRIYRLYVEEICVEIRIAHYPPYPFKWNPIEHRVFPHITRAMSGMILTSYLFIKELIENTTTKAGLKVFACISN